VPVADRGGRLRWSLPQGHIGAEETIEEAAVHEVEETGVRITASLRDVGPLMLATGGTPAGFPRTDLFTGVT
jgi:8-oxo-dGTP pyrophosphatase MutT (NUDIX family)